MAPLPFSQGVDGLVWNDRATRQVMIVLLMLRWTTDGQHIKMQIVGCSKLLR